MRKKCKYGEGTLEIPEQTTLQPDNASERETEGDASEEDKNEKNSQSESDDDLLPAFSSQRPNVAEVQYKKGDVVWAKAPRYPYWPALILSERRPGTKRKRHHKLAICFFDELYLLPPGEKQLFYVKAMNVRPFFCDISLFNEMKEKAGSFSEKLDYQKAHAMTEDYLRDRALGKIDKVFWNSFKRQTKSHAEATPTESPSMSFEEDDNSSVHECSFSGPCHCDIGDHSEDEDDTLEDAELPANSNTQSLASFLPRREMSATRRSVTMLPYIENIKQMKGVLLGIPSNQVHSHRHDTFTNGSAVEKRRLKFQCRLGPLDSEDAQDEVFNMLLSWYQSWFPDSKYDPVTYVADVLLPEAIIRSIQKLKGCSYKRAEEIFLQ